MWRPLTMSSWELGQISTRSRKPWNFIWNFASSAWHLLVSVISCCFLCFTYFLLQKNDTLEFQRHGINFRFFFILIEIFKKSKKWNDLPNLPVIALFLVSPSIKYYVADNTHVTIHFLRWGKNNIMTCER